MEFILALLLALSLPVRVRPRITRDGSIICGKCRYSLEGLAADAPCPECGSKVRGKRRRQFDAHIDAAHALGIFALLAIAPFSVTIADLIWERMYAIEYPRFDPPLRWYIRAGRDEFPTGVWIVWTVGLAGAVLAYGRRSVLIVAGAIPLAPALLALSVYAQWAAGSVYWNVGSGSILWRMAGVEAAIVFVLLVIRAMRRSARLR